MNDNENDVGDQNDSVTPKWVAKFCGLVRKHWDYHAPCESLNFLCSLQKNEWQIKVAPVFQEVYGGNDDGKKVWCGFIFDSGAFFREKDLWIQEWAVSSFCKECADAPKLMMTGKYQGHRFFLEIYLEPPAESKAREIFNALTGKVSIISESQEQEIEKPESQEKENSEENP